MPWTWKGFASTDQMSIEHDTTRTSEISPTRASGNNTMSAPKRPAAPAAPATPAPTPAISVSEAVLLAKGKVAELPQLVVVGEITGFRGPNARSGHCYFQVKDDTCAMNVTMWRGSYQRLDFELKDGVKVQMIGSFAVYDKRGSLSFHAARMTVAGEGLLRQQVAELARRLEREGLMDRARKRHIPRFCERVCVVTSLSGSVIDDVRRTLARRNPLVELTEVGCAVQGLQASASIIRALARAQKTHPDAILLVRGGGSFEDLMTFNDEALARAVAACSVPVITGIGHEPDTCICDMVADRRCSTPTAAAESVAPAIDEIENLIAERQARLAHAMHALLQTDAAKVSASSEAALRSLRHCIERRRQALEALAQRRCLSDPMLLVRDRVMSLELTAQRLHDAPVRCVAARGEREHEMGQRLSAAGSRILRPYEQTLANAAETLDALSPLRVLARGYAVVRDQRGAVISDAARLGVGDVIDVLFAHGSARAEVRQLDRDRQTRLAL